MISFLTAGGALTNLLLASRVFGGDDNDAAANGVVFFGGWAVLTYLAKQAGTMTAANTNLLILWNAASAALCAISNAAPNQFHRRRGRLAHARASRAAARPRSAGAHL